MKFRAFLILTFAVCISANSVQAQSGSLVRDKDNYYERLAEKNRKENWKNYFGQSELYYYNPHYKNEVASAFAHQFDNNFNFNNLRRYYSKSSYYDPMGDRSLNELSNISYIVINSSDRRAVADALLRYSDILREQLGNINVITMAIALSKEDSRFGDPKFYQWISQGLMKVVMRQGNGRSFSESYFIVSSHEEDLLLLALDGRIINTEFLTNGTRYYNIHTIEHPETKARRDVFIDVTLPVAYTEYQHAQKANKLDLR